MKSKMGQQTLALFYHYYPVAIFAAYWYSDDTTNSKEVCVWTYIASGIF